MVSPQKSPRLHPLIRDYLRSRLGPEALFRRFAAHENPLARLSGQMALALNNTPGIPPDEQISREASQLSLSSSDPHLLLYFLCTWVDFNRRIPSKAEESHVLLERAANLVGPATPVELVLLLERSRGAFMGTQERRRHFKSVAARFPLASPRRPYFVLHYLMELARSGSLADGKAEVTWLQAHPGDTAGILATILWINSMLVEARAPSPTILRDMEPSRRDSFLSRQSTLLLMLSRTWEPPGGRLPEHPSDPSAKGLLAAGSLWLLRQGDTRGALVWARHHTEQGLDMRSSILNGLHVLERAEIAARNTEAARALLESRRRHGYAHWLDELYSAQIEFLEGRAPQARELMDAALKSVEHYGAHGRLDFELAHSPLTRADWVRLMDAKPRGLPAPRAKATPAESRGASRLLGTSEAVRNLRALIRRLAPENLTLLIRGETGTGKELVARALHEESPRERAPFIALNCASISENLIASELFGHVKGAFTGAEKTRAGAFEEAGEGTLFLDEIGDISRNTQAALLRVLETGEVLRVGSSRPQRIHCRILAATHTHLEERIRQGLFREDLYFRLNRLELTVPPLRKRLEDIPLLATHFLAEERPTESRITLSRELAARLRACPWPGNVRQLRNEMEHLRILSSHRVDYTTEDLPERLAELLGVSPMEREPTLPSSPEAREYVPLPRMPEVGLHASERRRKILADLFRKHQRLTRSALVSTIGMAPRTATADLRALIREGLIRRVAPTRSARSVYFEWAGEA